LCKIRATSSGVSTQGAWVACGLGWLSWAMSGTILHSENWLFLARAQGKIHLTAWFSSLIIHDWSVFR